MKPYHTFDLDAPLTIRQRSEGAPEWACVANRQRNADGLIVCALCPRVWPAHLESELEWDRIVPERDGGMYTLRNGQLACPTCNRAKSGRSQDEAIAYLASVSGLSMRERKLENGRRKNAAVNANPDRLAAQRNSQREYMERQRRAKGVPRRRWRGFGKHGPLPGQTPLD